MSNTLNAEQIDALHKFNSGANIFISGSAGTGKSYLISHIIDAHNMNSVQDGSLAVCATTGVSALLIGGTTLHSFSGIGLGKKDADYYIKNMNYFAKQRWRSTEVLIVDEISMLDMSYFEKLNEVVKYIRSSNLPFGGIQLVLCGDFLQLPPINGDFVFQSEQWNSYKLHNAFLTNGMRQDNKEFFDALCKVRLGIVDNHIMRVLGPCIRQVECKYGITPTKLCPRRAAVMDVNISELSKLDGIRLYKSDGKFHPAMKPEFVTKQMMERIWSQMQIMQDLPLAVGAQVMLTKNLNVAGGLANGSRGVVVGLSNSKISVRFTNGDVRDIERAEFIYRVDPTHEYKVMQFPLLLAWAATIHKSQGMTLDYVEIDFTGCFSYGMVYVALSRARNLDGLFISNLDYDMISAHPTATAFYCNNVETMDR